MQQVYLPTSFTKLNENCGLPDFFTDYQICLLGIPSGLSTPDSRTPLLRPPSKSDWSGRKTGLVIHKGLDYFITWTLARAYLHTNSFVNTENVFRSALQNARKRSNLSGTASLCTPALSLFNTEQLRPALAAFSNNNAVFFLDQSTQHFDIGPYKTTFRTEPGSIPYLQFNSNCDKSNSNSIPHPVQNP